MSFFRGKPLVPANLENLLPEYQYQDYTSELTKVIGRFVGTFPGMRDNSIGSPMVIDNYIQQWTGGTGLYIRQIADAALRRSGVLPNIPQPAATLADIPVVKAFVVRYPSAQAESIVEFYERHKRVSSRVDTIRHLMNRGDYEATKTFLEMGEANVIRLGGIRESLGNMSHMIHITHQDPKTKPEEKRQIIDSIYGLMVKLSRGGNDLMDAFEEMMDESLKNPSKGHAWATDGNPWAVTSRERIYPETPPLPELPASAASSEITADAAFGLREGVRTQFGNGQIWTIENGKPKRVK